MKIIGHSGQGRKYVFAEVIERLKFLESNKELLVFVYGIRWWNKEYNNEANKIPTYDKSKESK